MNQTLHQNYVLVTGAASGIGRCVVETMLRKSRPVLAIDRDQERLASLASEYPEELLQTLTADLSNGEQLELAFAEQSNKLPPMHALAHCAGVWTGGSILNTQKDQWDHLIQNNLVATQNICRLAAKAMIPQQAGSIVVLSSNAARMPRLDMSAYCSIKAAVTMYTKCLALELSAHQIRCNVVSPGATQTPMQYRYQEYIAESQSSEALLTSFRIPVPLEGETQAQDIANIVNFLISDRAKSITMSDICADRGATLGV